MFICLTGTLLFLKRKERNKTTEVLVCSCCSSIFLFRKKDATSPKLSDLSDLLSFTLKGGCKRRAASLRIATVSPWGPSLCTHDKREFEKDFHVPELHLAFSVFIELSLILLLRNGASDAVRWCKKKSLCFTALSKAFFSPATTSSLSSWEYVIWAFCQIRDRNGCRDTDTLIQPLQRFPGSSLGPLLSVRFVQSISSGEARWFYSERLLLSNLLTLSPAMSSDISKRVVAAFSYFRWTYEQVAKIWTRPTYMAIVHAPFPDSTLETWLETKGR